MTAPSVRITGSGFRNATIYGINASGWLNALPSSAGLLTAYYGIQAEGARTLELNEVEPRVINITGDDRLYAMDALPALEGMTGTLTIARMNQALEAIVRNVTNFTLGEAKGLVGGITNESGNEPQCALIAYRQALTEAGARVYESVIFPKALLFSRQGGFTQEAAEYQFSVVPQLVTQHVWGTTLTDNVEGATQAQCIRFITQFKPVLVAWQADNTITAFPFATTKPAVSTAKIHGVWVNGVVDASSTNTTAGVTPTAKPSNGQVVVCFYEMA